LSVLLGTNVAANSSFMILLLNKNTAAPAATIPAASTAKSIAIIMRGQF
jgi:hypothetical protein